MSRRYSPHPYTVHSYSNVTSGEDADTLAISHPTEAGATKEHSGRKQKGYGWNCEVGLIRWEGEIVLTV